MKLREENENVPVPEPDDAEFSAWLSKQDQEIEREGKDLILSDMVHRLFKDKVELMKLYGNFDEKQYNKEISRVVNALKEVKKKTDKYLVFGTYQKKMDDIFDVTEENPGVAITPVLLRNKINSRILSTVEYEVGRRILESFRGAALAEPKISSLVNQAKQHINTDLLIVDIVGAFIAEATATFLTSYDVQFFMLDLEKNNDPNDLKDMILFLPEESVPNTITFPFHQELFMSPILFTYNNIFKVGDIRELLDGTHSIVKEYFENVLGDGTLDLSKIDTPAFMLSLIIGMFSLILYRVLANAPNTQRENILEDVSILLLEMDKLAVNYKRLYFERTKEFEKNYEDRLIATFGRGSCKGIVLNR
ncbi:MAG: hypothetical protein N3A54_02220 [Patescibacteria group bacterium]|nr:hypothetical protein [Patescibacteria group bacterium]